MPSTCKFKRKCVLKLDHMISKVVRDNKLTFKIHINNLCAKSSQKPNVLHQVSLFMSTNKKRLVTRALISSQFSYCPLAWMNHSRTLNNKINRIPERSL